VNPSSGGLHPVECYLLLPFVLNNQDNTSAFGALYHYCPQNHSLEKRKMWPQMKKVGNILGLDDDYFCIAVTTLNWREIWKYGERGFRYCQLDIGHAFGAILAAADVARQKKTQKKTKKLIPGIFIF